MDYFVISSKQSTSWDAVALDYFSRAGITDTREKTAVNTLVKALRANSNIWASLQGGFFYPVSPTSYGASLHNLLSSSFAPSPGTSPTYSTNGWSFAAASSQYLDTNFNPSTRMTINTGFTAMYIRSHTAANMITSGASNAAATNQWQTQVRSAANEARMNVYNATGSFTAPNNNDTGTYVFNILSNTDRRIRRNSVSLGTSSATVGGSLPNLNIYIGGRNLDGVASTFATFETSTWVHGLIGLSDDDSNSLTTMINTYNSSVIAGGR